MFARLLLLRCSGLLVLVFVLVALAALLFGGGFIQAVAIAAPDCEEDVVLLLLSSEEAHGLVASLVIYRLTISLLCLLGGSGDRGDMFMSFTLGMRFVFEG